MKNNHIFIVFIFLIAGLLGLIISVSAASTISISPLNINVKEGENFTLTITINPQDVKNYTAKLELNFPANLIKVESFSFGDKWMVLSQAGYDLIDNDNGVLIKTAGYPSGISTPIIFSTISFSTKKAGKGIIEIGKNSLIFDAENQNVFDINGFTKAFVDVRAFGVEEKIGVSEETKEEIKESPKETLKIPETETQEPEIQATPETEEIALAKEQTSLIAGIIELISKSSLISILTILVSLIAVGFIIKLLKKR